MSFLLFKDRVYGYLSYSGINEDEKTNELIAENFEYLSGNCNFKYICSEYHELLPFMKKEPYASFLAGASGYYLAVMTLGGEVQERINECFRADKNLGLISDASANAYLELKNEEIRYNLGKNISYLFSPGYQGSDLNELKYILDELDATIIGVSFTGEGLMSPKKSMAGIYAIDVTPQKKCGSCIMLKNCKFRKANEFCYSVGN